MFARLVLLFTIVPLIELLLLIELGGKIGAANTVAVVIMTGFAGAALARSQGFGILNRIQSELAQGKLPGASLLDGLFVFAGGLLLLTPGLLTDILGFCLLVPAAREPLKRYLIRHFKTKLQSGQIKAHYTVED
jgi:UPF0716 protein FxsA